MSETDSVYSIAQELYTYLASRFPICCASDEFVYFPQAVEEPADWSSWDDLSPDSVEDAVSSLRGFRERLGKLKRGGVNASTSLDALSSVLMWVTRTLEEQFTLVKTHATQPTFALTLVTVGLVQALRSGERRSWVERVRSLPEFLQRAFASLSEMSVLYRDLGVEMADEMAGWLNSLGPEMHSEPGLEAITRYAGNLSRIRAKEDFRLSPEHLERVVESHTGSALTLKGALEELEEEAEATIRLLTEEAEELGYKEDWESGYASIPYDSLPDEGKTALLEREIGRLRDHCQRLGFMSRQGLDSGMLVIEPLPESLASVRAADSYNATPGHPFRGGVFYIFAGGSLGDPSGTVHPVYRMTAAHEAYPGHHLLDLFRWNNPEPALRPIEYPLFYEGWACFGEDLMLGTGAFDRPYDRLILLRRRFRHAVRGKVDLLLHSGDSGLEKAAEELLSAGFTIKRAMETARKYALRPAYQMCYTIGRRRFQRLFDSHGQRDIPGFVNTVLSSGELLFEDLEKVLDRNSGKGEKGKRGKGEKDG